MIPCIDWPGTRHRAVHNQHQNVISTSSSASHSLFPTAPIGYSPGTAVSYVRVSTTQQADRGGERDGFSILAQREANRRQAHALEALVAAEFIDRGESGRSADRPELQRMLAYLREHAVDFVIVHKINRLARSRADDIAITEAVRASGARLVPRTENIEPLLMVPCYTGS